MNPITLQWCCLTLTIDLNTEPLQLHRNLPESELSGNRFGGSPRGLPISSRREQDPTISGCFEDVVFRYLRFSAQHFSGARCKYCQGRPMVGRWRKVLFQRGLAWLFCQSRKKLVASSFLLPCCSSLNKHYNSGWKLPRQHLSRVKRKWTDSLLCVFAVN